MARKSIIDTYYTFSAATKTIVIPRAIPRERLVLITNVTTNQVIYNFSDANLRATSYSIATDATGAGTTTTIVLNYNTASMADAHKLQIIVDEYDEKFTPSEVYLDAVNKLRVSQPQSLIDTDYEYSTQQTKWENLAMINNRPFAYYNFNAALTYVDIGAVQNSRTYYVSATTASTLPPVGQPIVVLDSLYSGADGIYVVESTNAAATGISATATGTPAAAGPGGSGFAVTYTVPSSTVLAGVAITVSGNSNAAFNGTYMCIIGGTSVTSITLFYPTNPGAAGTTATLTPQAYITYTGKFFYSLPTSTITTTGTVGSISGSGPWTATVTIANTTGLYVGSYISASTVSSGSLGAGGTYVVTSITANTSFNFTATGGTTPVAGTINNIVIYGGNNTVNNVGVTALYQGFVYSNANIPVTSMTAGSLTGGFYPVTVTTTNPHGLVVGNDIAVLGTTATGTAPNGSWTLASIPTPTTFVYYTSNSPGTITAGTLTGVSTVYTQSGFSNLAPNSNSTTTFTAGQIITGTGIPTTTFVTAFNTTTLGASSTISTTTLTITNANSGAGLSRTLWPMGLTGQTGAVAVLYQLTGSGTATTTSTVSATTAVPGTVGLSTFNISAANQNILVGQLVQATGIPTTGAYVGAILSNSAALTIISVVNYQGIAVTFTGTVSGTASFYNTGGTGTYQLSNGSATGTPTAASSWATTVPLTATGTITVTPSTSLYVKPLGNIAHRSFDGGVRFSTNASSHNHQFTRQTRRYFRYQSGKAIQISTGTTLKPQMSLDGLSYNSTTGLVTVVTKDPHNINSGVVIKVDNANETGYVGTFTISSVLNPYTFTYNPLVLYPSGTGITPQTAVASGSPVCSAFAWYGNSNRVGIFDNQNGMYVEHDGQTFWAVARTSTYQLFGTISVAANGQTVTGSNTIFSKQLQPNDFVVIRGMTYRVSAITSDTQIIIQPGFRGSSTIYNSQILKTTERRIPQYAFNIDRLDGTGPSGFNVDFTRMQMWYIDYSWYGTGFIRFGIRGADGNVIYYHRIINNNSQYLAYMRSGNLPGRYESVTYSKTSTVIANTGVVGAGIVATTDAVIYLSDTYGWPTSGSALMRNNSYSEYINYNNLSAVATLTFNTTFGSKILTAPTVGGSVAGVVVGQYISGPNIPSPSIVEAINNSVVPYTVTISNPAFVTSTTVQTFLFNPSLTGCVRGQAGASTTGNITAGSTTIGTIGTTTGVQIGQYVYGNGIPAQSYVISFVPGTSVVISQAATLTANGISIVFAQLGVTSVAQQTISLTAPTTIELHTPQFASEINHWGTSAIMDGQFTNDKQFVFTKGMTNLLPIASGVNSAVLSFRVAPSASNGIPATTVGLREIITRMQFIMQQTDILTNGNFLITLNLNPTIIDPTTTALNWQLVGGSSLSQYIIHNQGTTVSGGEVIFGFYLNTGAGGTSYQSTQQDLTIVRDLGTSILGGGYTSPQTGIYPDGPDVITIMAQNLGFSTSNIQARLSWVEAQA